MPTYDYVCRSCDHNWELFQSITANPVRKCPECSKLRAKRMIGTGAAVLFRGSGFYQTDYRSSSYKKGAEADKKARNGSEKKSDSSSNNNKSEAKSSSTASANAGAAS